MKKKKEIIHSLRLGEGMIASCGVVINTTFKKGVPSYSPKYTTNRKQVNCKGCLSYLDAGYIDNDVKEKAIAMTLRDKKNNMEKPIPPIEPKLKDYPKPTIPNGKNHLGEPLYQKLDWVRDYNKYKKDFEKYEQQLEIYEQTKLIRFIKNADEKFILRKYKITKK